MAPQRTAKLGEPALDRPETAGRAPDELPDDLPDHTTGGVPDGASDQGPGHDSGQRPDDDVGLFAASGPFEPYPGAVLLAARGARVIGATGAAEALARQLTSGAARDLEDAIAAALGGKAAQINPFFMETAGPEGEASLAYDLVALPWISGDAALVIARDITVERSLREALIESRQRYKDLAEASSDFAWETDAEGRFTFVSPRGALGYAAGQLVGQRAAEVLLGGGQEDASPFAARRPIDGPELWVRAADDTMACLSTVALPLAGADGHWCGARGVCREVTHEHERAAELVRARHREALLGYILRILRDELDPASMLKAAAGALVSALSLRGVAIYRHQTAGRLTRIAQSGRLPPAHAILPLLARILAGEDQVSAVLDEGHLLIKATRYQGQANGALCLWREEEAAGKDEENAILLTEIAAQVGVANEQLARERQLGKGSSTDPLTGLLNRRGLVETLTKRFSRAADRDQPAALFCIGLENIEAVIGLRGDVAGDGVLADLAVLLKHQIRRCDLAARLGGDEFALFLAGIDPESVDRKAASLLAAGESLRRHSASKEQPLALSIGVALYEPATPETVEGVIARADQALSAARQSGAGGLSLAEPAAKAK